MGTPHFPTLGPQQTLKLSDPRGNLHRDRLYVSLNCFVNSKVRGKREAMNVKRPQEVASCHARGWAHFPSCHDIFLDPGNPPECLSNTRRSLQLQI